VNELALFAGAGGGILGGHLLGWRTVCAVEWEPYAACVLAARQNDGVLPSFPIWDDVQTFDGRPWRGIIDVVSGGFPCQDISSAGKGAGINGSKSGMWSHMARIIGEVRPRYVYVENSPMLVIRGLGTVLGDLAALGFDARWGVVSAADVDAPHKRDRIWILADSNNSRIKRGERKSQTSIKEAVANPGEIRLQCAQANGDMGGKRSTISSLDCKWWNQEPGQTPREIEPDMGRVAHGLASRVDRLKAIGNGQVPTVAKIAWKILNKSA
jgi:DNA (cytosine-5)-methyltransferase 1